MDIIAIILSALSLVFSLLIFILLLKKKESEKKALSEKDLKSIQKYVAESISMLSNSVSSLIAEKNANIIENLIEKNNTLEDKIETIVQNNEKFMKEISEYNEKISKSHFESNTFIKNSMSSFKEEMIEKLSKEMKEFRENVNEVLKEFHNSFKERLNEFTNNTTTSISKLEDNVKDHLKSIREDNNEKLEKINQAVNEKLEKTLETKLKDSFESVIAQIGNVNTAVGEIKTLASDVGSLKQVLANVKTKGMIGEVILGNIIKEFLTPSQYEENISTKKGSAERVEFAVKLPGNKDEIIYLPIDSKFPYEPYSRILESTDMEEIKEGKKQLRESLLKYAKDVHDKYIDVPNTTDFALIFLPIEGLYLEALNGGLFEEIQRKYHVNLTGPTTLSAFITSLQMGFKSLLIQKRSADVFKLLGAVKTEFGKFAETLESTQKKVNAASDELDKLVGTRTRLINNKLKNIDSLDESSAKALLETEN